MLRNDVTFSKDSNSSPHERVFQLWPSGETFEKYGDYLSAMLSHKKPTWTCKFTGRSGLLYNEAYESEKKAEAQILTLSEDLRKRLVSRVHGSAESIEQLAQILIEMAALGPDVGDCIKVTVEGEAMIGKIVGVIRGEGPVQYKVELLGPVTETEISPDLAGEVGATGTGVLRMLEERSSISRSLAKKLIRGCASRKSYSSPWIVDDDLCEKYHLPPIILPNASKLLATEALEEEKGPVEEAKKVKEPPLPDHLTPEYPVPDLLIPSQLITSSPWPQPQESVHPLLALETWNFLHRFAEPLELAPFDLDDWYGALDKLPSNWVIWEEAVIALLKPLITYRREISKTAFANFLMNCLREDTPDLLTGNNEQNGEQEKRSKGEQSDYMSRSDEDDTFDPSSSSSEDYSSEENVRTVRKLRGRKKASIQHTRKSIRTLARSLPNVVIRPKRQAPLPFDFRTLKWHDSTIATQLLHKTQRKARGESSVASSLLLGMFVELEPQVEWIATFLGGKG